MRMTFVMRVSKTREGEGEEKKEEEELICVRPGAKVTKVLSEFMSRRCL